MRVSRRFAWVAAPLRTSSQVSPGAAIHSLCWSTITTEGPSINCMAGLAPKHAADLSSPAGLSSWRLLGGSIGKLQGHHDDGSLQGKAPAASRGLASARPSCEHLACWHCQASRGWGHSVALSAAKSSSLPCQEALVVTCWMHGGLDQHAGCPPVSRGPAQRLQQRQSCTAWSLSLAALLRSLRCWRALLAPCTTEWLATQPVAWIRWASTDG